MANERITTRNLNEKYRMECDRGEGHQTDRLTMRVVFFEGKTGFQSLLSVDICLGAKLYLHNIRKRRRKRLCVCLYVCSHKRRGSELETKQVSSIVKLVIKKWQLFVFCLDDDHPKFTRMN